MDNYSAFKSLLKAVNKSDDLRAKSTTLQASGNNELVVSLKKGRSSLELTVKTVLKREHNPMFNDAIVLHIAGDAARIKRHTEIKQWLNHQVCVRSPKSEHTRIYETIERYCALQ